MNRYMSNLSPIEEANAVSVISEGPNDHSLISIKKAKLLTDISIDHTSFKAKQPHGEINTPSTAQTDGYNFGDPLSGTSLLKSSDSPVLIEIKSSTGKIRNIKPQKVKLVGNESPFAENESDEDNFATHPKVKEIALDKGAEAKPYDSPKMMPALRGLLRKASKNLGISAFAEKNRGELYAENNGNQDLIKRQPAHRSSLIDRDELKLVHEEHLNDQKVKVYQNEVGQGILVEDINEDSYKAKKKENLHHTRSIVSSNNGPSTPQNHGLDSTRPINGLQRQDSLYNHISEGAARNLNLMRQASDEQALAPASILAIDHHQEVAQTNLISNAQSNQTNTVDARLPLDDLFSQFEAKLFLRRNIAMFITLSALALVTIITINKLSILALFGVIYCYLFYILIENIIRTRSPERESWRATDDIYATLDIASGILFLAFIHLNLLQFSIVCSFTSVPFIFITVAYFRRTKASQVTRNIRTIIRCHYITQTALINLQFDGLISWDWRIIMAPTWLFFVVTLIYFLSFAITLIIMAFFLMMRKVMYEGIEEKTQVYGTIWYFFYYGLGIIGCFAVVGFCQELNHQSDFKSLINAAYGGLPICLFMTIFSILTFKKLLKFVELFSIVELQTEYEVAEPQEGKKYGVDLQTEKNVSYFVMLSTTYFSPLNKAFFSKNDERLQKIKNIVYSSGHKPSHPQTKNYEDAKRRSSINIQTLKKDKEVLDNRMIQSRVLIDSQVPKHHQRAFRTKQMTTKLPAIEGFSRDKDEEDYEAKHHLSADNIIDMSDLKIKDDKAKPSEEEKLCYLCYANPSDAVLMSCRHGGICYDCAVTMVKKKNECMECRGTIEAIYRIDPNPKMKDIVKATEITKVKSQILG